jgi:hypothetical protein
LDKVYYTKKIFWIATLFRKISRKMTFDFKAPYIDPEEVFLGKLVMLRYSLALASFFCIKVHFPPNTDTFLNPIFFINSNRRNAEFFAGNWAY